MSRLKQALYASILGLFFSSALNAIPLPVDAAQKKTPPKQAIKKVKPTKPAVQKETPKADEEAQPTSFATPHEYKMALKKTVARKLAKDVPVLLGDKNEAKKQPTK
jgi:hypothetical protein